MSLQAVQQEVERRLALRLPFIIEKAMARLEAKPTPFGCSYAAYNMQYVRAKAGHGSLANVAELRQRRYTNPCYRCAACRNRRKPWPVITLSQDGYSRTMG